MLRLGGRLLRIVRCVDVRQCKWTHRAHRNERGTLRGGEVVGVRRDGPRVANLHRLCLRGIEGIAHTDEERPPPDRRRQVDVRVYESPLLPFPRLSNPPPARLKQSALPCKATGQKNIGRPKPDSVSSLSVSPAARGADD